jgi:hypothetical protein
MLHPNVLDVKITLASHDKVWWVIIVPNNRPADRIYSQKGSTTKEAAMENMLVDLSQDVWWKLQRENISLPK